MSVPFGLQVLICTIINGFVLFGLDYWSADVQIPIINYIFVFLFALTTFLIHQWLMAANRKSPRQFVTFFMGSITLKLFFTITLLFIYIYLNRDERIPVALSFMSTYLLFTVIEVVSLYKLMTTR
jgi:hypothetical protein